MDLRRSVAKNKTSSGTGLVRKHSLQLELLRAAHTAVAHTAAAHARVAVAPHSSVVRADLGVEGPG